MSISSAILAANQAIEDNGDYMSTASVSKAVLYLEALNQLIALRAQSQSRGGSTAEELRFDQASLMKLRTEVSKWLSRKRATTRSQITHLKFGCFRD